GGSMPDLNITPVRGLEGIKTATLEVGELGPVRVAVAHGLANAGKLLDMVVEGREQFHFIEIMACPGGCIGGGGQSLPVSNEKRLLRSKALYQDDLQVQTLRQSHENPAIKVLYDTFLKEPLGEKSHHLLHTRYQERGL
ncbi:iron hydrogenase small subunit, partial [bacterium]|nr:iron hydrogenase small subunit [bacterium]